MSKREPDYFSWPGTGYPPDYKPPPAQPPPSEPPAQPVVTEDVQAGDDQLINCWLFLTTLYECDEYAKYHEIDDGFELEDVRNAFDELVTKFTQLTFGQYKKLMKAKFKRMRVDASLDKVDEVDLAESPDVTELLRNLETAGPVQSLEQYGVILPKSRKLLEWRRDRSIWVKTNRLRRRDPPVIIGRVYNPDRMRHCFLFACSDQTVFDDSYRELQYTGVSKRRELPGGLGIANQRGITSVFSPRKPIPQETEVIVVDVNTKERPSMSTSYTAGSLITFFVANAGRDVERSQYQFKNGSTTLPVGTHRLAIIVGRDNWGKFKTPNVRNDELIGTDKGPHKVEYQERWRFGGQMTVENIDGIGVRYIDGLVLGELLNDYGFNVLHIEEIYNEDNLPANPNREDRDANHMLLTNATLKLKSQGSAVKIFEYHDPFYRTKFWKLVFPFVNGQSTKVDRNTLVIQPIGERLRYKLKEAETVPEKCSFRDNVAEDWPCQADDADTPYYSKIERIVYSIVFLPPETIDEANRQTNVVQTCDAYELDQRVMHYVWLVTAPNDTQTAPWVVDELYPNVKVFQIPAFTLIEAIQKEDIHLSEEEMHKNCYTYRRHFHPGCVVRQSCWLPKFGGPWSHLWHLLWLRRRADVTSLPRLFRVDNINRPDEVTDEPGQRALLNQWQRFLGHDYIRSSYHLERPIEYYIKNGTPFRVINVAKLLAWDDSLSLRTNYPNCSRSEKCYISGLHTGGSLQPIFGIGVSTLGLITQFTLEKGTSKICVIFDYADVTLDHFERQLKRKHDEACDTMIGVSSQHSGNKFFMHGKVRQEVSARVQLKSAHDGQARPHVAYEEVYYPLIYHYLISTNDLDRGIGFGAVNIPRGLNVQVVNPRSMLYDIGDRRKSEHTTFQLRKVKPIRGQLNRNSIGRLYCGEVWADNVVGIVNPAGHQENAMIGKEVWSIANASEGALYTFWASVDGWPTLNVDSWHTDGFNGFIMDEGSYSTVPSVKNNFERSDRDVYFEVMFHCLRAASNSLFDLKYGYPVSACYDRRRNTWFSERIPDVPLENIVSTSNQGGATSSNVQERSSRSRAYPRTEKPKVYGGSKHGAATDMVMSLLGFVLVGASYFV